jgi:hypothetical protein
MNTEQLLVFGLGALCGGMIGLTVFIVWLITKGRWE